MNYDQDIEINPEALDVEWTKQSKLMFTYSKLAAEARDRISRVEEKLEVFDAKLSLKIRKNPANFGQDKPTEASIKSLLTIDPTHIELTSQIADARYELEILNSAVKALDGKRSALENLVRLHAAGYFAGPKVPRDIGKEWVRDAERTAARNKIKESRAKNRE